MSVTVRNDVEIRRAETLKRLDAGKTQAERNRLGQFATPPDLAFDIIEYAMASLPPRTRIRFLEPGFGTGAFYSALLRRCGRLRIVAAVGYEVDSYYADAAKEVWADSNLVVRNADFTMAEPPNREKDRFNLVVCNPPYVRHHHLTPETKCELQSHVLQRFGFEINGLSGLYTYFLILSKAWMTNGGIGAWLIPTEFMDVNYGRKLKEFLLEKVTLQRVHRFDPNDVQFDDALVSSAVVVFRNALPPSDHKVEFTFGASLIKANIAAKIDAAELRTFSKWTSLARRDTGRGSKKERATLGDLFTIKRGLATGCNEFFVLTPEEVTQWKLPPEFLTPILPSPRYLDTDEVCADASGRTKVKRQLFLLGCNLPEKVVRERYSSLWKYLQHGRKKGVHERYLCRHREPWYSQEKRPPAPILCTYMGRTTARSCVPFRFILNRSNATAANVYLMLYPNSILSTVFRSNSGKVKEIWEALSSISAEMLTGEGRTYGGALHKLEPKELANVSATAVLKVLRTVKEFRMDRQLEMFIENS